jgi:hypothetical protein
MGLQRTLLALGAATILCACVPKLLPTPFTADQIRDALPRGTRIIYRVQRGTDAPVLDEWTFTRSDEVGATVRSRNLEIDGRAPLTDWTEERLSWTELRDHASYEQRKTTVEEGRLETPMGAFDTVIYIVQGKSPDGEPTVSSFEFGKDLAGPPLRVLIVVSGKQVLSMEMIERGPVERP